jgi:hypothetical protein
MKDREKTEKSDRSTADSPPGERKSASPNPPRTTTGKFTAPKFGSAGSGGAELDSGPERD